MRRIALAAALLFSAVVQQGMAWSTPGWLVLDEKTIEGTWVSLDQESGEVCRLRIRGSVALLVITAGPTQSEYVFRSSGLVVKNGKFSARMARQPVGMMMDVAGEGRADTMSGVMTLRMKTVKQDYPPWKQRTDFFVKECCGAISEVLVRNDKRARALIEEAAKVDEPATSSPAGVVPETCRKSFPTVEKRWPQASACGLATHEDDWREARVPASQGQR